MNNVFKNFVLFFMSKIWVRLIHACDLYSNKYGIFEKITVTVFETKNFFHVSLWYR